MTALARGIRHALAPAARVRQACACPFPMLNTDTPSTRHPDLDTYATPALLDAFIADQDAAVAAVKAAMPQLAAAVDAALPRIRAGGRLLYAGAGTSGRLGVLDSVELYPTFSWPRERAVAVIA